MFDSYSKDSKKLVTQKVNKILNKIEKNNNKFENIIIDDVYPINKSPKYFLFIRNNPYILNIIFDLKFLEKFNKDVYYKTIILLEYFLKYYYKTIIGEYNYEIVIDMLIAIRKNILNLLVEQTYSIPINLNLPDTKYDINNTDIYINKIIKKIQAYTYKKIKNLGNKNLDKAKLYNLPKESNLFINTRQIY